MPAVLTPTDITRLLVNYLLEYLATTDVLYPSGPDAFERVYGNVVLPPSDATTPNVFPLVTLHRFGPGREPIGHIDRPFVQFDVWAGDDPAEAQALADAIRVAVTQSNVAGAYDEGVITGSEEVTGPQPLYDSAEGRMRFTFSVQFFVHPAPPAYP